MLSSSRGMENLKPQHMVYNPYRYKVHILKSPLTEYNIKPEAKQIEEYLNNGWEIIHQSTAVHPDSSAPILITVFKKYYETT